MEVEENVPGIHCMEARNAAMHRTAPTVMHYLVQNINSAAVEKSRFRKKIIRDIEDC